MEHYYLTESDIAALHSFTEWFRDNAPLVVEKDNKYGVNFRRNTSVYQLGAVIGYKGKTIYAALKTKSLTSRNLSHLTTLMNELKDQPNKDGVNRFKSKVEPFMKKIKGQVKRGKNPNGSQEPGKIEISDTIEVFENKSFYCYERLLDSIGRKIIKFGEFASNKKLSVTIRPAQRELTDWTGTAYCDSTQDFLIIESSNSNTKSSNTNYMIRVQKNYKDLTLCIGHMTFQNLVNTNVVTKTILIERIEDDQEPEPKEFKLSDTEVINSSIKEGIIRFLNDRSANRLSSPHTAIITDYDKLARWHKDNDYEKTLNRNDNLLGQYSIYYSTGLESSKEKTEIDLTEDTLIISETLNMDLMATYSHKVNRGQSHIWEGEVITSAVTKSISIFLHGHIVKRAADGRNFIPNDNPIYLLLNIPDDDEFDTLAGIITGIRDNDKGSIGMLAVALKIDKDKSHKPNLLPDLKKFFDAFKFRSWVRPPVDYRVSTFKDLISDGAIEEGLATKRIIRKMLCDPKSDTV